MVGVKLAALALVAVGIVVRLTAVLAAVLAVVLAGFTVADGLGVADGGLVLLGIGVRLGVRLGVSVLVGMVLGVKVRVGVVV